jgi:hypothetical protein
MLAGAASERRQPCRFGHSLFVEKAKTAEDAVIPKEAPVRYLLLIYVKETTDRPPAEVMEAEMKAYGTFTDDIRKRGLMEAGEALEPTTTATTVRVQDGRTVTTDGPFAETKEALGGFYLVNARDLDEAIELAARIPAAKHGAIEVRPIWEQAAEQLRAEPAAAASR